MLFTLFIGTGVGWLQGHFVAKKSKSATCLAYTLMVDSSMAWKVLLPTHPSSLRMACCRQYAAPDIEQNLCPRARNAETSPRKGLGSSLTKYRRHSWPIVCASPSTKIMLAFNSPKPCSNLLSDLKSGFSTSHLAATQDAFGPSLDAKQLGNFRNSSLVILAAKWTAFKCSFILLTSVCMEHGALNSHKEHLQK